MDLKRNQIIAIAIVSVVLIAGVAIVVSSMNKSSGHDLVFANGNKDCYEPTWLADQLGYYKDFGADVEMLTVSGGGKALEALQSGKADIAGFGSTPLANQLNKNVDDNIVVLGRWMGGKSYSEMATLVKDGKVYDFNHPKDASAIDVTYFDNSVHSVTTKPIEGSGMKIGMDTTTGYKAALGKYATAAGLKVSFPDAEVANPDIKVVHVEFGNQVAALDNGDVDAIMGGSYDLAAYASLNDCVISSPSEDNFPTLVSEATCVLAATKEAYATKYTQIVGVLKALQKACCYIYGIDYEDGLYLDETIIKDKQAAMSDANKNELFGTTTPSANGYFYTTDACKRIADFFGAPFTTDVQKLSYDKYIWAIDFELVDMKIVEATYNASNTGTGSFRTLNAMDYMNYFDGRALYDALKNKDGVSSWTEGRTNWYKDAAIYFGTLYDEKYTITSDAPDDVKVNYTVNDGIWIITLTDADGHKLGGAVTAVRMSGGLLPAGVAYDYDPVTSELEIYAAVTGSLIITAEVV